MQNYVDIPGKPAVFLKGKTQRQWIWGEERWGGNWREGKREEATVRIYCMREN